MRFFVAPRMDTIKTCVDKRVNYMQNMITVLGSISNMFGGFI